MGCARWVVALVLATSTTALAQSPRAGGPAPGDDPASRLAIDLGATGQLARGLIDRDLISARGVITAWDGPWGAFVQPYWLFGRVNTFGPLGKITTDNEIYVRTGIFRQIVGPTFAFVVNVYDHSLRRQIDNRDLFGSGVGANIVQSPGTSLLASLGLIGEVAAFKHKVFDDGTMIGNTRDVARLSLRVYGRYKLADGHISLTHDIYLIPSVTDPTNDYRMLFYGAVDIPIIGGFSARAQVDATREGLIMAGTKHDDIAITFGLAFKNEWRPEP
jgi:uncharacterized protein DUF481